MPDLQPDWTVDRSAPIGRTREEITACGRSLRESILGTAADAPVIAVPERPRPAVVARTCPECDESVPAGVVRHPDCFRAVVDRQSAPVLSLTVPMTSIGQPVSLSTLLADTSAGRVDTIRK